MGPHLLRMLVAAGALASSSCAASLLGTHNLDAMDLARDCRFDEAMEHLELAVDSGNSRQAGLAFTIEAAVLLDQGRGDESEALYPEIRIRRGQSMSNSEIEAKVREVLREIRDARERQTGSRNCP